jgi:hypothetical protein
VRGLAPRMARPFSGGLPGNSFGVFCSVQKDLVLKEGLENSNNSSMSNLNSNVTSAQSMGISAKRSRNARKRRNRLSKAQNYNGQSVQGSRSAPRARSRVSRSLPKPGLFVPRQVVYSEVAEVEAICQSLAVPLNNKPVRFASEYTTAPTVLAAPWDIVQTQWSQANSGEVGEYPPDTDAIAFLFRDPVRAAVIYDANVNTLDMTYQALFSPEYPNALAPVPLTPTPVINANSGSQSLGEYLAIPCMTAVSAYAPHGPTMYAGVDGQTKARYFWIDATAALPSTITANFNPTGNAGRFTLDAWDDGVCFSNVVEANFTGISTSAALTVITPGYYAVRLATEATMNLVSLIYDNPGNPVFTHLTLPDLQNNAAAATKIRISAVSLCYTNKTAPLNKEGEIVGVQLPAGRGWTKNALAGGSFSFLSSLQNAKVLPIDNGMYGFLKPTSTDDFTAKSYFSYAGTFILDSAYPLKEQTDYLCMCGSVISPIGRNGYWTRAYGIEYLSTDVWRDSEEAAVSADTYRQALVMLKDVQPWIENPLHWGLIWKNIKAAGSRVVNGIQKYGPSILKAAAMAAPLLL